MRIYLTKSILLVILIIILNVSKSYSAGNNVTTNRTDSKSSSSLLNIIHSNQAKSFNTIDHIFNILIDLFSNQTFTSKNSSGDDEDEQDSVWPLTSSVYPTDDLLRQTPIEQCKSFYLETCCKNSNISTSLFICYNCQSSDINECPCNCNSSIIFNKNDYGNGKQSTRLPDDTKNSNEFATYDFSLNSYTFALSIGLPCISILFIICSLIGITYCCRSSTNTHSSHLAHNSSNQHLNVNDINRINGQLDSNGALSVIYVDLDEQNTTNETTPTKTLKENMPPPPTYHELFRSRTVDRLPTYNSFRQKLSRLTKQQQSNNNNNNNNNK
jgi:hypothetical protein